MVSENNGARVGQIPGLECSSLRWLNSEHGKEIHSRRDRHDIFHLSLPREKGSSIASPRCRGQFLETMAGPAPLIKHAIGIENHPDLFWRNSLPNNDQTIRIFVREGA